MSIPLGISSLAMLFLAPGVPPPVEDAPVAAHATITRVEAELSSGPECVSASGEVAATYSGDRYPLWEYRTPWRWCDGNNMLPRPVEIDTVWTGRPDVDTPIRVRVALDTGSPEQPAEVKTQSFWFYPYGSDGDCVTKVKQVSVTAAFTVNVEIRFCG